MKSFEILYGTSKNDKIKKWIISVKMNSDKTATIITENGYVDGKMNVSHRVIKTGRIELVGDPPDANLAHALQNQPLYREGAFSAQPEFVGHGSPLIRRRSRSESCGTRP